jgi:transposase-like protein
VLLPKQRYSEERKAEVLRAYQERSSLQGLSRTFGITRKTITQWLKKLLSLPTVKETLFAAKASDVPNSTRSGRSCGGARTSAGSGQ